MLNKTFGTLFSLSILLSACGPTDPPTSSTTTIAGRVIDGYVSGATVFLDLNYNGIADSDEPSALSGNAGQYELALTSDQRSCLAYAPLVVEVPVGAVDADLGTVTQAYSMTLPPSFDENASQSDVHITPLTSVIWQSAQKKVAANTLSNLNCDSVKADVGLQTDLTKLIDDAIAVAVAHYNMSQERIFADFVASGDIAASDIAQKIVKGLQASVAHTAQLQAQYPDAALARVSFFQSDDRDVDADTYPDAWYRETYLITDTINRFELIKIDEDLETEIRTIIYGNKTTQPYDNATVTESFEFESRKGDDSPYSCDIKEGVRLYSEGIGYELVNLSSRTATEYNDCVVSDFAAILTGRYAFIDYEIDDVDFSTQYHYPTEADFPFLNDWVNLNSQSDYIDFDLLVPTLNGLSYRFDDTEMGSADWWVKTKTFRDGDDEHKVSKNQKGEWKRIITYANGESITQCRTDGVYWQTCVE